MRNLFPSSFSPDTLQSQGCPGQMVRAVRVTRPGDNLKQREVWEQGRSRGSAQAAACPLSSSPLPSSGHTGPPPGTTLRSVCLGDLAKQKKKAGDSEFGQNDRF